MPGDQGFVKIEELLAALTRRLRQLREGTLDLPGLDRSAEEARELYERIVVLRHLARVDRAGEERRANAPLPSAVSEGTPIRLETGPPPDPRQITLIDAIENEKKTKREKKDKAQPASVPALVTATKPKASVAEKLEHAPIKDLPKSIAISQKFWFIAELFAKDASAYDSVVRRINSAGGLEEARTIVDVEVVKRSRKPPAADALAAFTELVERRFK